MGTPLPRRWSVHEWLWSVSRRLHRRGNLKLARVIKAVNFHLYHNLLPAEARVGEGVILEHHGMGVVIHPNTVIGNNVRIWHNVTIAGQSWIGSGFGAVIEDDVMIGCHALILPRDNTVLRIGAGALIGAGAIVTKDVPAGATIVGVAAGPTRSTIQQ